MLSIKNLVKCAVSIISLAAISLPSMGGVTIYYVHNDHLGPRVLTDENQNVVWQAERKPFGEMEIIVNTLEQNARFPGQWEDAESGFVYNYFRDYDPSTGRYIQSDPTGLYGGLNTYGYVLGNPLSLVDKYGLKPGDFFNSFEEAAADAGEWAYEQAKYVKPTSINHQKYEWGGWIYCNSREKKYTYGDPATSNNTEEIDPGMYTASWNIFNKIAGEYHTHGDGILEDGKWNPEVSEPSINDQIGSDNSGFPGSITYPLENGGYGHTVYYPNK